MSASMPPTSVRNVAHKQLADHVQTETTQLTLLLSVGSQLCTKYDHIYYN